MKVLHLGWAGVEVEHDGQTLLIDCIKDSFSRLLSGKDMLSPSKPGSAKAALVTHLHGDHADPAAIATALAQGAPVFRPEPNPGSGNDLKLTEEAEARFREFDLEAVIVQPWKTHEVGPFRVTAVPAVDGEGDPQRSWIVECEGARILHCGDTMFHGYWWGIAQAVGHIDVAFLPINGARVDIPHKQPPSPLHAAMLPEQAAVAAHLVGARTCVPIHYGLHNPPEYSETPRAIERFLDKAKELRLSTLIPKRGEWFSTEAIES